MCKLHDVGLLSGERATWINMTATFSLIKLLILDMSASERERKHDLILAF